MSRELLPEEKEFLRVVAKIGLPPVISAALLMADTGNLLECIEDAMKLTGEK